MILAVCANPSVDKLVTVDDVLPGKVNRVRRESSFAGGKGVHVALATAELGMPVKVLGFWGGLTGNWVKQQCRQRDIECAGPEVAEWTRSCLTLVSSSEYNGTEFLGSGPTLPSAAIEEFLSTLEQLAHGTEFVTFSGSWPGSAENNGYGAAAKRLVELQKRFFIDFTGPSLSEVLNHTPFLVHLNQDEAEEQMNTADPVQAALTLAQHCHISAITCGKEGAYVACNGSIIHASCPLDNVQASVGSGDCLIAGMAVALAQGKSWQQAACMGVACGAANCLRVDLGMLYKKDVDDLLPKVTQKVIQCS